MILQVFVVLCYSKSRLDILIRKHLSVHETLYLKVRISEPRSVTGVESMVRKSFVQSTAFCFINNTADITYLYPRFTYCR
jgi:hypothetical protein